MRRKIITYGGYFERFIVQLTVKERKKLDYLVSLLETEDRLPVKFIKYIREGLYELRMEYNGNIYRVFFIFDEGQLWSYSTVSKRKAKRRLSKRLRKHYE